MSRDEDIFAEANASPISERDAVLARACAGDPALRARVEHLLAGYAEAERALPGAFFARETRRAEEQAGGKIGRYKLLQKIGEGGFGVVWMAEQHEPIKRRVALGRFVSPEFSPDSRFLCTETPFEFQVWSVPPRLQEGTPVPEWLLRLATVFATKTVDDAGQLVDVADAAIQYHDLRRQLAALPGDAPLVEWGRWILDDRANRSIAPGFTLTPEEAKKTTAILAAELVANP